MHKNYNSNKNNVNVKVKSNKELKYIKEIKNSTKVIKNNIKSINKEKQHHNKQDKLTVISNKLIEIQNKLNTHQTEINTQYDMFRNMNTSITNINKQLSIKPLENGIIYINLEYANISLKCNYVILSNSIMIWCSVAHDKFRLSSINGLIEFKDMPLLLISPMYYGTINIINTSTNTCYTGIIGNSDSKEPYYLMGNRPLIPLGIEFNTLITLDLRITNKTD